MRSRPSRLLHVPVAAAGLALAAAAVGACGTAPSAAPSGTTASPSTGVSTTVPPPVRVVAPPSTVYANDPAAPVAAVVGQTVALRVQTNPSTDDGWEVVRYDQDKLFDIGASYDDKATSAVPGRPVNQNLLFRATAPGTATVTLRYGQPNTPSPTDTTVTFTITVT